MNKRYVTYSVAAFASLITLAVYLPALRNGFVIWDDGMYVYENKNIRSLGMDIIKWAFTDYATTGNWHPLTWLSYALDHAVWGLDPFGYHLTAILLHAVNAFIVVMLTIELWQAATLLNTASGRSPVQGERKMLIAGSVTGLLFGLHPLHVEPAAWIADRRDLLCTLFFLLSILFYIKYAVSRNRDESGYPLKVALRNKHYLMAIFFMLLAVSSKSMTVTLPFVLLLLDWYPLERVRSRTSILKLIAEKAPFLTISIVLSGAAFLAQQAYKSVVPLEVLPTTTRILAAVRSLMMYLWKMAMPSDLLPFYPYPENVTLYSAEYLAMIAILCGLTGGFVYIVKKNKIFLAIWIYYLVTLAPVIGIIQIGSHSMADRYVYLPSIGPFLLAGTVAAWLWERADSLGKWGTTARRIWVFAAMAMVLALSWLTLQQIAVWKNTIDLWSHVIEKEPNRVPIAYNNRGLAFKEQGQLERALSDFSVAIALAPSDAGFYNNRGTAFGEAGEHERAIEDFTIAIQLDPAFAPAYSNRGLKFEEMGKHDRALVDLQNAIRLNPSLGDAYLNRGLTFENMGRFDQALEDYDRAIAIDPSDYMALSYRGIVLGKLDRMEYAIEEQTRALSIKPDYADAYLHRGELYRNMGNIELALNDYQTACNLGSAAGCRAVQEYRRQ